MSLLMDALRRAEEAKRLAASANQAAPGAAAELSLDPLEPPPLSARFEAPEGREAEPTSGPTPALPGNREPTLTATPSRGLPDSGQRSAARNVFAAKQSPRSRTPLWLFLGLGGIAAVAIVAYFWWQLQAVASGSLSVPAAAVPPTAAVPPAAALQPVAQPQAAAPLPAAPPPLAPLPSTPLETPRFASATPRPAPPRVERAPRPASAQAQTPGVFRRSRPKTDPTLELAYADWQAGRLDDARRAYREVLRHDPRNADALHGLAAIAARQGHLEQAQEFYLRVLEADPSDVAAQAALISLRGASDSSHSESRLKTLLASQPEAPALYFALGNVYGRQGRWRDAQQAYFQAYALDPDNADYLFNVAVSLDHLHQGKLALQYYRMALHAAGARLSAFDTRAAEQRIAELEPPP